LNKVGGFISSRSSFVWCRNYQISPKWMQIMQFFSMYVHNHIKEHWNSI